MKKILKILIFPFWKPFHWLFVEEVFFIEEKRTMENTSITDRNVRINVVFYACKRRRLAPYSLSMLNSSGNETEYSEWHNRGFNSKEDALKAIEIYKLRKNEDKTIVYKV